MSQKISFSAPAKVLFTGEHSVVYNKPALVSAFDLRLKFSIWEDKQTRVDDTINQLFAIAKDFLTERNITFETRKYNFEIDSQIPISQGFGSSAALSVASSACFLEFLLNRKLNLEKDAAGNISEDAKLADALAYEFEKKFHGKPSGVDNSASFYGGFVFFRKEFEFLKNINPLSFQIPQDWQDKIYLIYSGKRTETTLDLVKAVAADMEENPALIKKAMNDIEKTTRTMTLAIQEQKEDLFVNTINRNNKLLKKIGVIGDKALKILQELKDFGVGKMTGTGGVADGSGYLIFYCKQKQASLEKYLQDHKILYFKFAQAKQGLKRETV